MASYSCCSVSWPTAVSTRTLSPALMSKQPPEGALVTSSSGLSGSCTDDEPPLRTSTYSTDGESSRVFRPLKRWLSAPRNACTARYKFVVESSPACGVEPRSADARRVGEASNCSFGKRGMSMGFATSGVATAAGSVSFDSAHPWSSTEAQTGSSAMRSAMRCRLFRGVLGTNSLSSSPLSEPGEASTMADAPPLGAERKQSPSSCSASLLSSMAESGCSSSGHPGSWSASRVRGEAGPERQGGAVNSWTSSKSLFSLRTPPAPPGGLGLICNSPPPSPSTSLTILLAVLRTMPFPMQATDGVGAAGSSPPRRRRFEGLFSLAVGWQARHQRAKYEAKG
mmetsp:Transcript_121678/g.351260  ORF Transcript_121678/g.351260 Transcript_121678/m.351260 type:complete len:339 (-) Transcript_121678:216-1232(-)